MSASRLRASPTTVPFGGIATAKGTRDARTNGFSRCLAGFRVQSLLGRQNVFRLGKSQGHKNQHLPDRVDHAEKGSGNFRIQGQLAIAQTSQQVLADVCDLFQLGEG